MRLLRRPLAAALSAVALLLSALPARAACTADARTLCLLDSRFAVQVHWKNQHGGGAEGEGTAVPLSDKTGAFWFFEADNLELMLKMLDGRPLNGRFWIFFGALSDVEYQVTVTDTATSAQQVYLNPPGHTYGVTDTGAFSP
ncbi:MAG TPA: hypothetical protein VOA87_06490, partial [Thermoanaerobaculia bacterium]|nr:hypothetical protein [Thermoanaerobaculia bacterium]